MIEQCIRHIKFEVFRTHVLNALYALVAFHVFLFLEQTNIVSKSKLKTGLNLWNTM